MKMNITKEWLSKFDDFDEPNGCPACGAIAGCCSFYPDCPGGRTMRAKMRVSAIEQFKNPDGSVSTEKLNFSAVAKSEGYPADGSDEDNTFARYTPTAELSMYVANPALHGRFAVGDKFYVDFTPVT